MLHRARKLPQCAALLALLSLLLAACGGAPAATTETAAPTTTVADAPTTTAAAAQPTAEDLTSADAQPTAPAEPQGEEAIKASIQQTLDTYAQAYNENDAALLKQAVDQKNAPLRRFFQTRFDTFQQSLSAGQVTFGYEVQSVKQLDMGFVQAHVASLTGGVAEWTFREVDGKWLLSEPTKRELGKREEIEGEHFTFFAYKWAEDDNEVIMRLMDSARERVREKLGQVPDQKAEVYINPTYGVASNASPNALAYYQRASTQRPDQADKMVVFAPQSFVFGFYDESLGWEKELEDTLTHEYAHLVNNRMFTPMHRMNNWMSEGLAEYVADAFREGQVSQAVAADYIIPIIDTSGVVNKQDLENLTILEKASDRSLAYGFAASLVRFIDEKYGGLDGFWKLVQAYDKLQKFDPALQEAFGISYEQFDQEWRAWLKETY